LSFIRNDRFKVLYASHEIDTPNGRQIFASVTIHGKATMSADLTLLNDAGEIVDSSEMQRERQRKAHEYEIGALTNRIANDLVLGEMIGHWERYAGDVEGRLHPLYDLLEVTVRIYKGRSNAAAALGIGSKDLDELGHITNDKRILNGRHPGQTPGPHSVASDSDVNTCERVARLIIERYAAKTP
jgi:hypothetical protein